MIRTLILFFFFLSSIVGFSQYQVIDSKSKSGIPYTHVKLLHQSIGLITNFNGEFKLDSSFKSQDSLQISCIGYKERRITVGMVWEIKQIELKPKTNNLNEVVISAKNIKFQTKKLGVIKSAKSRIHGFKSIITSKHGEEKGVWIPNEYSLPGFLKSVNIYVAKTGYPNAHFRVHVYDCDPLETKPGKELTKSNVIASGNIGNEWVKVNLEKENIQFSENGCFIGIEWFDSPEAKHFSDTVFYKDFDNKQQIDVRSGNGMSMGYVLGKYKNIKNRTWIKVDDAWKPWGQYDESKFHIPDTTEYGYIYTTSENSKTFVPCIYSEVIFERDKIESIYRPTKKRKFNKIDKVKKDLFKYPQANLTELFSSLIKTFENDDIVYALKYLCVYKEDEQIEIINELEKNKEQKGGIVSKVEKRMVVIMLKQIKKKLPESTLTKIDSHHYELNCEGEVFNFSVEDGLWKINPYSYKIHE